MMLARLGDILVKANLITDEQLKKALEEQKKSGVKLGQALIKLNFITEENLVNFLSKQYGVPAVNLSQLEIEQSIIDLIPPHISKKYEIIPVKRSGSSIVIAMADPTNIFTIDDIKFITGYNVEPVVASEGAIIEAMKKYYAAKPKVSIDAKDYTLDDTHAGMSKVDNFDEGPTIDVEEFDKIVQGAVDNVEVVEDEDQEDAAINLKEGEEAPIVKLVNGILIRAIKLGVSDIHMESFEKSYRVRYRVDGVCQKVMVLPTRIKNSIISRIKIMSNLDISERRLPQDGRIKLKLGRGREMDFRVSVLPCLFGEKIVMRLLDKSNLQLDMTKLGFTEKQISDFKNAIHKPFGMVLVTGPTGSGKTTTLYSALADLNKESENIMTAEDPVEFNLMGINQVQIKDDIGLNFAAALRSFLRQDPDIIMVGEIRDFETAEIAVKAALTGHMVLSTLHTNDAPSTVNRLLNMGIEPFLVSSAVNLILAQRLARKICQECKEPIEIPKKALLDVGIPEAEIGTFTTYKGKGCSVCNNSGYKGRIALYEVMPIGDELKELILNGASALELRKEAVRLGMMTLRMSGLEKFKLGITTIEEVIRCSVA